MKELQAKKQIFPMFKYDVKVVESGRFRDVIVMKWSYTHHRGSNNPVLKALKILKILVFQFSGN